MRVGKATGFLRGLSGTPLPPLFDVATHVCTSQYAAFVNGTKTGRSMTMHRPQDGRDAVVLALKRGRVGDYQLAAVRADQGKLLQLRR